MNAGRSLQAFGSLALSSPQQKDSRGSTAPQQVSQRSALSPAAGTSSSPQAGAPDQQQQLAGMPRHIPQTCLFRALYHHP